LVIERLPGSDFPRQTHYVLFPLEVVGGYSLNRLCKLVLTAAFLGGLVRGDVVTWDGEAGDGLMDTALNWNTNQVPAIVGDIMGAGDDLVIVDNGDSLRLDGNAYDAMLFIAHDGAVTGGLSVTNGSSVHVKEIVLGCGANFSGGQNGANGTIRIGPGGSINADILIWISIEPGNTFNIDFVGAGGRFYPGSNEGGAGAVRVWNKGWNWAYSSWQDLWNRGILTHNGVQVGTFADNFTVEADGTLMSLETLGNAFAPTPQNNQTNVPFDEDLTLAWSIGADPADPARPHPAITGHFVYFGVVPQSLSLLTDNKLPAGVTALTINRDSLQPETTYFWRVDEELDSGGVDCVIRGTVWRYTTSSPPPMELTGNPVSQTVEAGCTVVLEVAGTGIASYQWHRNGTVIADDGRFVGATTGALTISDFRKEQEGAYTCIVANGFGASLTSRPAVVMTRRLIAMWKFEDDLNDQIGDWPGSSDAPLFADGIAGRALKIQEADNCVTVENSEILFNFYTQGFSVNAWIKPYSLDTWSAIVSKKLPITQQRDWQMDGNGIQGIIHAADFDVLDVSVQDMISTNQWHMITMIYDAHACAMHMFVDGLPAGTSNVYARMDIEPCNEPVRIGAEYNGGSPWHGLLDEIAIWSYPLDAPAVAELYTSVTGNVLCLVHPVFDLSGPDGLPDCRVNMIDLSALAAIWLTGNDITGPAAMPDGVVDVYDLAGFASEWLRCNLTPSSACD